MCVHMHIHTHKVCQFRVHLYNEGYNKNIPRNMEREHEREWEKEKIQSIRAW